MYHIFVDDELVANVKYQDLSVRFVEIITEQYRSKKYSIPNMTVYEDDKVIRKYEKILSIDDMNLSVRATHILKKAEKYYITDLLGMSATDLLSLNNLGAKCTAEILNRISEHITGKETERYKNEHNEI